MGKTLIATRLNDNIYECGHDRAAVHSADRVVYPTYLGFEYVFKDRHTNKTGWRCTVPLSYRICAGLAVVLVWVIWRAL